MQRTLSTDLVAKAGKEVLIKGFLNNIRELGKISFLIVRDRKGFTQVVIEDQKEYAKIKNLQPGSILSITGKVQKTDQTEIGAEIIEPKITVEVESHQVPPVEYAKPDVNADIDTILDNRAITLRNRKQSAIFKIQAEIVAGYREFMMSKECVEFFGPTIIGASSEGGAELFTVNYFDQEAMLSQSAQLYKQIMVSVHERVFALMKCYRAENSNTRRHLTEATQFEFEMGFIENMSEVQEMLEGVLRHITERVNKTCAKEIKLLDVELPSLPKGEFPKINFKDALELYYKRTGIDERNEDDLSPSAEKEMCKYAKEEYGSDYIFINHYLRKKTAFYAKPNEENPEITNYFDLLCREFEIVSGGQRINEHDELVESLKLKGLNPDDFQDYLSIFKQGMPKHGGFGMGMERLTMQMLGLENIREATLFPSDPKRIAGAKIKQKTVHGGENVRDAIIKRLKAMRFEFEHNVHEETPTSEDASRVRGTKMEEGVKAIIIVGKKTGKNYMFNVPAHKKIDMKKVKEIVGENCEFEKPEEIEKKYGLIIGGVPPFGTIIGIETYIDSTIGEEEMANFNAGLRTESISMKSKNLVDAIGGQIKSYTK